jgi:hypothetical protein
MRNDLMFATGNDVTGTPWPFFNVLNDEFRFGCDVAALYDNRKTYSYLGPDHPNPSRRDCLTVDWPTDAPNWLNPPYSEPEHACKFKTTPTVDGDEDADFSKCKKKLCVKRGFHDALYRPGCIDFVRKAAEQQAKGATTVALLAARTDTEWFHEFVWDVEKNAPRLNVEVRFVRGRLKFEGHKDSAPFPSLVVVFRGYPQ